MCWLWFGGGLIAGILLTALFMYITAKVLAKN